MHNAQRFVGRRAEQIQIANGQAVAHHQRRTVRQRIHQRRCDRTFGKRAIGPGLLGLLYLRPDCILRTIQKRTKCSTFVSMREQRCLLQ